MFRGATPKAAPPGATSGDGAVLTGVEQQEL